MFTAYKPFLKKIDIVEYGTGFYALRKENVRLVVKAKNWVKNIELNNILYVP
jgi:hypothetical protein